jgi:hypothetical protein
MRHRVSMAENPGAKDSETIREESPWKRGRQILGSRGAPTIWDSKKIGRYGLAVLVIYVASAGVLRAASKPFWFDELCTLTVAKQPTFAGTFDALRNATDSQPPPFDYFERVAGAAIPDEEIAYRLPSILALCCTIIFVFIFVSRWCSATCALACAALPLLSILYLRYAVEARGYALATAFMASALLPLRLRTTMPFLLWLPWLLLRQLWSGRLDGCDGVCGLPCPSGSYP